MNCKDCKKMTCELNGVNFEITIQKCDEIDKLTKGQVPDGYKEIEPEFDQETTDKAVFTIQNNKDRLAMIYDIIGKIDKDSDKHLSADAGDTIENICNKIVESLNEMDVILDVEENKWLPDTEITDSESDEKDGDESTRIFMDTETAMKLGATYKTVCMIGENINDLFNDTAEILSEEDSKELEKCVEIIDRITDNMDNLIRKTLNSDDYEFVTVGGDDE